MPNLKFVGRVTDALKPLKGARLIGSSRVHVSTVDLLDVHYLCISPLANTDTSANHNGGGATRQMEKGYGKILLYSAASVKYDEDNDLVSLILQII